MTGYRTIYAKNNYSKSYSCVIGFGFDRVYGLFFGQEVSGDRGVCWVWLSIGFGVYDNGDDDADKAAGREQVERAVTVDVLVEHCADEGLNCDAQDSHDCLEPCDITSILGGGELVDQVEGGGEEPWHADA